jgi:hypothetical protein
MKDEERARLLLSQDEINDAWATISLFNDKNDFIINRAIIFSSIVMYCRPFKRNNTNNGTIDQKVDFESFNFSDDVNILHNNIIAFRDKIIAHSDGSFHDVQLIKGYKNMRIQNTFPYYELFEFGKKLKSHFEIVLNMLYERIKE